MPRELTPPSSSRPSKRTRIYRACQYCVSGKTRCEDVQAEGCYLCRKKGKDCSLKGMGSTEPTPTTNRNTNMNMDGQGMSMGTGHGMGHYRQFNSFSSNQNQNHSYDSNSRNDNHNDEDNIFVVIDEQEKRYKELEEKFNQLEKKFNQQLLSTSSLSTPMNQDQPQTQTHVRLQNGNNERGQVPSPAQTKVVVSPHYAVTSHPLLIKSWQSHPRIFDENLFGVTDPKSLPDIIESGLLNRSQVEMAFQMFKHRFSLMYPLSPFLRSSTSAPQNSLMNLAMLYHVGHDLVSSNNLQHLLDQTLSAVFSGVVSYEIVFGLFILSLCPVQKCDLPRSQPSSLRMISLAYQIGCDIGLPQMVENVMRHRKDLAEPWMEGKMDLVLLWSAVINRYNILHIICTPVCRRIPSSALLIPDHPSETMQTTIRHLRSEALLINLVEDIIENLVELEVDWTQEKLNRCTEDSGRLRSALKQFRQNVRQSDLTRSLEYDSRAIEFSLVIRLAIFIQQMPSPVKPDIRMPGLHFIGTFWLPTSRAMIDLTHSMGISQSDCSTIDPGTTGRSRPFPSYIVSSVALAFVSLRRAMIHTAQTHPDAQLVEYEIARKTEKVLLDIGGTPSLLVKHTAEQLGPLGESPYQTNGSVPAPGSGNGTILSTSNALSTDLLPDLSWPGWDWSTLLLDPYAFDVGSSSGINMT
ncbi:uncharacterized protein IL334_000401 [Kwoniella shivajii]|uniref:Zn(2)-C6 fungal-type domain-containing protein n=1 Tax=Kwoniella shivajii TaxID=564305 RepID=A0ABZ1CPC5_9TREE|nr:hypothetical protein IL334_000401 [Kwoniella shivajii]